MAFADPTLVTVEPDVVLWHVRVTRDPREDELLFMVTHWVRIAAYLGDIIRGQLDELLDSTNNLQVVLGLVDSFLSHFLLHAFLLDPVKLHSELSFGVIARQDMLRLHLRIHQEVVQLGGRAHH